MKLLVLRMLLTVEQEMEVERDHQGIKLQIINHSIMMINKTQVTISNRNKCHQERNREEDVKTEEVLLGIDQKKELKKRKGLKMLNKIKVTVRVELLDCEMMRLIKVKDTDSQRKEERQERVIPRDKMIEIKKTEIMNHMIVLKKTTRVIFMSHNTKEIKRIRAEIKVSKIRDRIIRVKLLDHKIRERSLIRAKNTDHLTKVADHNTEMKKIIKVEFMGLQTEVMEIIIAEMLVTTTKLGIPTKVATKTLIGEMRATGVRKVELREG